MRNPSAVLHAPHVVRVEDRLVPQPDPQHILVEIGAVGICGSDVHYFERGRIGPYVVNSPMVIGHESAGTIVGVGAEVDAVRVAEMVALGPGVPCRRCRQCQRGRCNPCPEVAFFATPPHDGAICRYVAIDSAFAHRVPAGVSVEQAAMAEPVSVDVWAARKTEVGPGDRVLVSGAGPIGLLAGQVARACGSETPTLTDPSEFRLQRAQALGLRTVPASTVLAAEFDVLLECSGSPAALTRVMAALAPGRPGGPDRHGTRTGQHRRATRPGPRDHHLGSLPLRQHLSTGSSADQQRRRQGEI